MTQNIKDRIQKFVVHQTGEHISTYVVFCLKDVRVLIISQFLKFHPT